MTTRVLTPGAHAPARTEERAEIGRYTASFGLSLAITAVLNALLVLVKETQEPVMAWMASLTGHHWVTHGLFDVLVFLALGFGLVGAAESLRARPRVLTAMIVGGMVVGALILVAFNL